MIKEHDIGQLVENNEVLLNPNEEKTNASGIQSDIINLPPITDEIKQVVNKPEWVIRDLLASKDESEDESEEPEPKAEIEMVLDSKSETEIEKEEDIESNEESNDESNDESTSKSSSKPIPPKPKVKSGSSSHEPKSSSESSIELEEKIEPLPKYYVIKESSDEDMEIEDTKV